MFPVNRIKKNLTAGLLLFVLVSGFFAPISLGPTSKNITVSIAEAQAVVDKGVDTNYGGCSLWPFEDGGLNCWAAGIVYILFHPTHWLAGISATILDYFIEYSISRSAYAGSNFMSKGWEIVRDLVNIGFIFMLLYIAFLFILGTKVGDAKKLLIRILIIATVVNFSLFISRVIIDGSNATAHVFFTPLSTQHKTEGGNENVIGSTRITQAVINKMRPQELFLGQTSDSGGNLVQREFGGKYDQFIVIYILAALLNLGIVYIFISVSLLFVGRVIGLWLYTIFSPVAFLSYATPFSESTLLKYVGWKDWWKNMLNLAFMAPIFLFLLYLIVSFLGSFGDLLPKEDQGSLAAIVSILVPFLLIWVLLQTAKRVATTMSGEMAEVAVGWAQKAGGAVFGVASLSAAVVGRSTLGRASAGVAGSEKLKEKAQAGGFKGWRAQKYLDLANWGKNRTFDVRSTVAGKKVQSAGFKSGYKFLDSPIKSDAKYQKEVAKKATEKMKRYGYDSELADEKKEKELNEKEKEIKNIETQIKEMDELETELSELTQTIRTAQFGKENERKTPEEIAELKEKQGKIQAKINKKLDGKEKDGWMKELEEQRKEAEDKIPAIEEELEKMREKTGGLSWREAYAKKFYVSPDSNIKRGVWDKINRGWFMSEATRKKHAETIRSQEKAKKAGEKSAQDILDDLVKKAGDEKAAKEGGKKEEKK